MSSRLQTLLFLPLLVYLVNKVTTTEASRCEKVTIPFCQGLGYNQSIFPNNLGHEAQEEARIDATEFASLVESQCSRDIVYFLCSLYAPVCTMMGKALRPCRSLCKSARNGCEDLMNTYGFTWPRRFECERFPKAGRELCVGRSSSGQEKLGRKSSRRTDKKKRRHRKRCSSTSSRGKYCCKLGRRAAKKGLYCNLKTKEKKETRRTIRFRKTVIRKCSRYSSCFHSCCEVQQRKRAAVRHS